MSIDLTSLPKLMPEPKKLNLRLWAFLLVAFIFIGAVITVAASFFYRIPNALFLSGIFVFPVLIWGGLFLYRFYAHSYCKAYNNEWNLYREQRKEEMINDGQRGLSVLGYLLVTQYGKLGNAANIIDNKFLMTSKLHPKSSIVVPHTTLPINDDLKNENFSDRLQLIFTDWEKEIKAKLDQVPTNLNLHVRLFIDAGISEEQINTLWTNTLGKLVSNPTSLVIEAPSRSSTFIESWLDDKEHDNDLLLVINAHMFFSPEKNQGEFASWLLLAGEKADIGALLDDQSSLVKVHRSEQTSSLNQTIDNALLWGSANKATYGDVWYNGVSSALKNDIVNHFNQIEFKPQNMVNVESAIGYAGLCSYWLGLSLAIENAVNSKNNQLIVIGKPKVAASVVSYLQNNITSSSDNGNV
jgi:hypothetical protein